MDIESRIEELARARAAGQIDEAEWMRRRKELLRELQAGSESAGLADQPILAEAGELGDRSGLAALAPGMVIGPDEYRVRLLRDLDDKRRVWLVLAVTGETGRVKGSGDDFRVIKLFLPPGYVPGPRDPAREERSQRAGVVGWRAYLAKARSRVEQATKLEHPNIVAVHGWWQGADGWPFAEMEYVDHQQGQTLAQLLRERGSQGVAWDVVLRWLKPVAAALDYARQEHRLAHQGLDAEAVFLTTDGTIKLGGFGVASEIIGPRGVLADALGSAADANSEGFNDGAVTEAAFRRDVFSLALLIFQMLTGRGAHEAKSQGKDQIPPGLTADAWRVLRRGLAYPSETGPIEAGKFIDDLDQAQRSAKREKAGSSSRSRVWLAAAGFAALVVGILGVYWATQRGEGGANLQQPAQTSARTDPDKPPEQTSEAGLTVLLKEADREADLKAFESAKRMDTPVAYQLYLQRCPSCGFEKEARSAIRNLQNEEKVDVLKADFETLVRAFEQDNREDRGEEARERLNALARLAPADPMIASGQRRLALAWVARAQASAKKGDLAGAWQELKKASAIDPGLPELASVTAAFKQAEVTDRVRQADTEAFASARRANTRKAYWAYLERCAETCGHRTDAEAALTRLSPSNRVIRDRLRDGSQGPELVVIPAGSFEMGSPPGEKGRYEDEQQHAARIAKPFAIGKYEVTFADYDRFTTATGRSPVSDKGWGRDRRPVINISWREAKEFTDWLSEQSGYRYRLPTETEWEYAVRAGTSTSRYWGDDPDQGCAYANAADQDGKKVFVGWTEMRCRDGYVYTAPAGSYRNNDYGLHDMLGNVLEWTCSFYTPGYEAPAQTCQEPVGERQFVVRGGSWNDEPRNVRSGDRHRSPPDFRDYFLGFRVVRELP